MTPSIFKNIMISPAELTKIIDRAAAAPFTTDLLAVDEPLWGSFWQGDVMGPGSRLPGVELALLRAVRLDSCWPAATTLPHYLADLRAACRHPQAGVWTLTAAGEPCVILAAPVEQLLTVVWYGVSTGTLHAGYRTTVAGLRWPGAVLQRAPAFGDRPQIPPRAVPGWLSNLEGVAVPDSDSSAARLDQAILRLRRQAEG